VIRSLLSVVRFLPLVWRNLGRNKLRSLLTGAAIALAVALVCLLRTMPGGLDALLSQIAKNSRISVHNEAGIVYSLPYAYLQKVRGLPGVVGATSWSWFGGAFEEEKGVTFPNFAVDAETVGVVYEDLGIDPQALDEFRRRRDAMLVGRQTLRKYGWKIGDRVTLKSTVYPVDLDLRIVGEIPNDADPRAWIQREYLTQALQAQGILFDQVGIIWARVDDPARVNEVMRTIDELFRNSEAETASETEKSFFGNLFANLQGFVTVILLVTGMVTLCIVFIAANTASMSIRERVGEIAVMKALGFRWRTLFGMLVLEATLLSTLAGAGGASISLGLAEALQKVAGWNPQLGPLASFVVTSAILVQGVFLALFVGILSGVVPAFGASRRSVAATLREVF
jgi:putative ABC transport system permease protein